MVNQNNFECEVCMKSFKSKANLGKHMRSHRKGRHLVTRPMKKRKATKPDTLTCGICDECFMTSSELHAHELTHMDEETALGFVAKRKRAVYKKRKTHNQSYVCTVCYKSFPTNFKLVRHGYTHMAVKPFPCDVCGRRFSRKDHLQVHYRIHTGEKTCYCTECGQGFNSTTALHRHIDRLHSIDRRTVICAECGLEFAFKAQLKRHYDVVHKTSFTCEFCGNISGSEIALFRHLRKHVLTEPYVCLMCSHTFNNTDAMKEHECYPEIEDPCKVVVRVALADLFDLDFEVDPLDQYDAQKLQRKFDNRGRKPGSKTGSRSFAASNGARHPVSSFGVHNGIGRVSLSDANHVCKFCEKVFTSEADKLAHEAIHIDGYDSSTCCICKMKFTTNSKLAQHLRVHTGENPFPCKFCTKAFPRQDYLQRHMFNVHVTDKETCPFCFRFCPTPEDFTEHLKTHQDAEAVSSFFCDSCDMYFSQYCDYKMHMLDFHSSHCYKCKHCLKVFFDEETKTNHQFECQQLVHLSDDNDRLTADKSRDVDRNELSLQRIESHECEFCGAIFTAYMEMLKHLKAVHKPSFYNCDLCPCKFATIVGLKNHRYTVHAQDLADGVNSGELVFRNRSTADRDSFDQKLNHCNVCNREFESLSEFLDHAREHACENMLLDDLKCVLCDQNFLSVEDLSEHLQSHEDNMIVEVGVHDGESDDKDVLTIDEDACVTNNA